MAKLSITAGGVYDVVSPDELGATEERLAKRFDILIRQFERGLKPMRLFGEQVDSAASVLTQDLGGPRSGYIWSVRRLSLQVVGGTTASVDFFRSTDTVSTSPRGYITSAAAPGLVATFSGNSVLIYPDEHLLMAVNGSGSFHTLIVNGEALECPAEMIGKLF